MKTLVIVIALLISTPVYADEWESVDTYRQLAITALFVADRNQTQKIVDSPDYYETNVILGRNPSHRSIDEYFLITYGLYSLAYYYLPEYREAIFGSAFIIQLYAVGNNINIGLGVGF